MEEERDILKTPVTNPFIVANNSEESSFRKFPTQLETSTTSSKRNAFEELPPKIGDNKPIDNSPKTPIEGNSIKLTRLLLTFN